MRVENSHGKESSAVRIYWKLPKIIAVKCSVTEVLEERSSKHENYFSVASSQVFIKCTCFFK